MGVGIGELEFWEYDLVISGSEAVVSYVVVQKCASDGDSPLLVPKQYPKVDFVQLMPFGLMAGEFLFVSVD